VELVGVTTAYGNTSSALCHADAKRLLALAGRSDVPVARGAGWRSRDLRATDASRAILAASETHAGALTILALAPPTNVAAALAADPALGSRIAELVLMGGRSTDGLREFNLSAHPAASRAALAADCPTTLITHELCISLAISKAEAAALCAPGSLVASFRRRLLRFTRLQGLYRSSCAEPGEALGGFHPWDVIAAAWLVAPEIFGDVEELAPTVEGDGRVRARGGPHRVRAPRTIETARFKALMAERLARVRASGD
jgi:inosine-uridine nucleoside N-ribohydrolase